MSGSRQTRRVVRRERPVGLLLFLIPLAVFLLFIGSASAATSPPFPTMAAGFTQSLYGTAPGFFGGIAFAPNGDVWVDGCGSSGGSLIRFSATQTYSQSGSILHQAATAVPSDAGCGLTNGPGGRLYSNTSNGVATIDANTGAALASGGSPGNALGIAADPSNNRLAYVGADCRFSTTCTIYEFDPSSGVSTTYATLPSSTAAFVDGIAFDPSGQYLFMSDRSPGFSLLILNRAGAVVQQVALTSEPDGIAFHTSPEQFVVTDNTDGTMTQFVFPGGDFTKTPTVSQFASGGFRGDLSQVGPDSCLYLTQDGTRYGDGTLGGGDSIVQICPGFVPPPGVTSNRYVALGDSVPYGHGLSNPYPYAVPGLSANDVGEGPSPDAYPGLVARHYGLDMSMRLANCPLNAGELLSGDDLAFSGAAAARGNFTPGNDQCPNQFSGTVTIQNDELPAANLSSDPARLVTIQAGADDINFSACLLWELSKLGPKHWAGTQCVVNGGITDVVRQHLVNLQGALTDIIEKAAPYSKTVVVLDYYQIIPKPSDFARSSVNPSPGYVNPVCFGYSQNAQGAYNDAVVIQTELNLAIIRAVNDARSDGVTNVKLVDLSGLEAHHEMCTGSPAVFSGEPMTERNFQVDVERSAFSAAAKAELQAYSWRAGHPNQFGQQDIANAVEAVLGS